MTIETILLLLAVFIVAVAVLGLIAVAFHDRRKSKGIDVFVRGHRPPNDASRRRPRS
ncbi:hypothetical protein H0A73_17395 [Alcaligenaceae bacterium]|nr:hypothetical protein [Alcaligenaceae bacterium]